jgi:hypothetical protein
MTDKPPPKPGICHILWNEDPANDKPSKLLTLEDNLRKIGFDVKVHPNLDFRATSELLNKEIFPLQSKGILAKFGFKEKEFDMKPIYQDYRIFMMMVYTYGSRYKLFR